MTRNKLVLIAVVGALAVSLGLSACGGSASNSASSSSAASSTASASASSSAASSSSSSAASSTASASASASSESEVSSEAASALANTSAYWAGTLEDGSSVDYFDDANTMKPGLVILSADGTKGKSWVGDIEVGQKGSSLTFTITDDGTKEKVTYIPSENPSPGTMQWEIEGYGKVTLEKASGGSYQEHLAQVGK